MALGSSRISSCAAASNCGLCAVWCATNKYLAIAAPPQLAGGPVVEATPTLCRDRSYSDKPIAIGDRSASDGRQADVVEPFPNGRLALACPLLCWQGGAAARRSSVGERAARPRARGCCPLQRPRSHRILSSLSVRHQGVEPAGIAAGGGSRPRETDRPRAKQAVTVL